MCLYYNEKRAFFTSEQPKRKNLWSCQKVCVLSTIFWTIFIRFGSKLYRQIVGIPMGINCARFVAYLFCLTITRLMLSLSDINQADAVETLINLKISG